jgi:hypothetical protein
MEEYYKELGIENEEDLSKPALYKKEKKDKKKDKKDKKTKKDKVATVTISSKSKILADII